jgi:hypothetical protein
VLAPGRTVSSKNAGQGSYERVRQVRMVLRAGCSVPVPCRRSGMLQRSTLQQCTIAEVLQKPAATCNRRPAAMCAVQCLEDDLQ